MKCDPLQGILWLLNAMGKQVSCCSRLSKRVFIVGAKMKNELTEKTLELEDQSREQA